MELMLGGMIMLIYMKTKTGRYDAVAEFDPDNGETIVKGGSKVSPTVASPDHFRSANAINKKRGLFVVDGVLQKDLAFKRPSSAACFVGGNSHNGYDDWKDEKGRSVREILKKNGSI